MSVMLSVGRFKQPSARVAWAVSATVVVLMAVLRLGLAAHVPLPIGYGVPVVLLAFFRNRRVLWLTTLAFAILSIIKFFFILPDVPAAVHLAARTYDFIEGGLVLLDLVLVAGLVDIWIITNLWLERHNADLGSANADLAAREEEIARQNEELQSQTEELERQSEELRVANEELAHREKILEMLLSLSRSLNTDLSPHDIMNRICETLGLLINGPGAAAAVIEQQGDDMVVRCHHGFGPGGLQTHVIPRDQSFAQLIQAKDRTGYIEDLSARPDLKIPQPKEGDPMVAIIATPLRVRGLPMGSLEVYSRNRMTWNQEQVALVESLAAQTSVSLEAAQLFETVMAERNRFEEVLRTAPVGMAVCDARCAEVRLNPAGAALLNVPANERIHPELFPTFWRAFQDGKPLELSEHPLLRAARRGEDTYGLETELVLANGRRIICLMYARPIRNPDGAVQGSVCIFVDITVQKELQRELDLRRREAEEASVRKTRFLAAVSHDIRTPANAISLLAELIRRSAATPALASDVPELALELHSSAVSLVNLLSDVLDVARFDSDRIELQESEFSVRALLADEQKHLLPLARQKGLSLVFDAPSEPLLVRTDRIKLARILGNLVGNAIKFTETGEVRIDAHRNGENNIRISVTDTGIGIPAESLSHIFDEFFQLRNPERDRAKGSGLGLAICKRLVDAMGARIDVESTPNRGSTFTVTLPAFATMPSSR